MPLLSTLQTCCSCSTQWSTTYLRWPASGLQPCAAPQHACIAGCVPMLFAPLWLFQTPRRPPLVCRLQCRSGRAKAKDVDERGLVCDHMGLPDVLPPER